jgi:hypothetical protein
MRFARRRHILWEPFLELENPQPYSRNVIPSLIPFPQLQILFRWLSISAVSLLPASAA